MTRTVQADGRVVVETGRYRLDVAADGLSAALTAPDGRPWLALRPLAALDRVDGLDETLSVGPPRVVDGRIEVERRSTAWDRAGTTIVATEDALELQAWAEGTGDLTDVQLLAGRSVIPGRPHGLLPTGSRFRTLFSPNPADARLVRPAAEAAVIGVSGDGTPGRTHWVFTPAPLYLALTGADDVDDPAEPVDERWLDLGLAAPVAELGFVQLVYAARDGAFHLRLEYEGHTRVEGAFRAPALVLTPDVADPYTGLRRHRDDLVTRGAAPDVRPREVPAWWRGPIFCGWGAQCHLAARSGEPAAAFATQESYDAFLDGLETQGVVPGTVVIDDKWQAGYGSCAPDTAKWPDLRGWIARRHERGQRVLLWWKAWDPEGLAPELCVRNGDGDAIAVDPTSPATREALRALVHDLVGPDGLDADGFKVDFTARTPSGRGLTAAGEGWGIALLHELLAVVYGAAKEAKADALVITHTPHPAFVDVTDMIRLNDVLAGAGSVVPQMRHRARVARAACPELLVDTDDWPIGTLAAWREFLVLKPEIGVPSLYYATHLDASAEPIEPADYAAIRRLWEEWEATVS